MIIRLALPGDDDAILRIIMPTIRAGETCALPADWTEALGYWRSPGHTVFVAEAGAVAGTCYIRPNQRGGGHVANCAFMTAPAATARGVAGAMCSHALRYAAAPGFKTGVLGMP